MKTPIDGISVGYDMANFQRGESCAIFGLFVEVPGCHCFLEWRNVLPMWRCRLSDFWQQRLVPPSWAPGQHKVGTPLTFFVFSLSNFLDLWHLQPLVTRTWTNWTTQTQSQRKTTRTKITGGATETETIKEKTQTTDRESTQKITGLVSAFVNDPQTMYWYQT